MKKRGRFLTSSKRMIRYSPMMAIMKNIKPNEIRVKSVMVLRPATILPVNLL